MLFNSLTFLIFFAVVLGFHFSPLGWTTRKVVLLLLSYVFYGWWNPPFVGLLWLSTIVDWYASIGIDRSPSLWAKRCYLTVSMVANLGLLGFFKYGNFVLQNVGLVSQSLGLSSEPSSMDIILPVGISFYTFQTMSYTLDVYRGQIRPWNSFLDFALYVTFFPQLVAGPIVRGETFLPQLTNPPVVTRNKLGWGLSLLLVGMFNKIVVADGLLAPVVEKVYAPDVTLNSISAWCGTLAFSGQIFCDFAGYSTAAIGVALCLGFSLPDNFRFPYAAVGFSDFWARWHISLSTWLRDYLYIPLGGNRRGTWGTYRNLMLTMLLGGLWHGASWTFVAWGGLHGLLLVLERLLKQTPLGRNEVWQNRGVQLFMSLVTYVCVCFTWVFFRAVDFQQAKNICSAMCGLPKHVMATAGQTTKSGLLDSGSILATLVVMSTLLALHQWMRHSTLEAVVAKIPWWIWSSALAIMGLAILVMPGEDRAFIYFQF